MIQNIEVRVYMSCIPVHNLQAHLYIHKNTYIHIHGASHVLRATHVYSVPASIIHIRYGKFFWPTTFVYDMNVLTTSKVKRRDQ